MYLTISEVILISDKNKRQPEDAIVYAQQTINGKHFIPDYFGISPEDIKKRNLKRYGTIYTDKTDKENWCIVPDEWIEEDALSAKMSL